MQHEDPAIGGVVALLEAQILLTLLWRAFVDGGNMPAKVHFVTSLNRIEAENGRQIRIGYRMGGKLPGTPFEPPHTGYPLFAH